ncbi:MAG: hypothetical protein PHG76_10385, partial [Eubacteriales bacterium]|nr:hypothetical protein [Eubacteriales bacterium]
MPENRSGIEQSRHDDEGDRERDTLADLNQVTCSVISSVIQFIGSIWYGNVFHLPGLALLSGDK